MVKELGATNEEERMVEELWTAADEDREDGSGE
jgi:hypothetical protein